MIYYIYIYNKGIRVFCHLMKKIFLKMSFSVGKDENWYHESGKHKISPI